MSTPDMGEKRRLLSPQMRRRDLRSDLLHLYQMDPRFRDIVEADLRPVWQRIERDARALLPSSFASHPHEPPHFYRLQAAAEGRRDAEWDRIALPARTREGYPVAPPAPPTPEQRALLAPYVEVVRQHVTSPLRLIWNGQPTD